MCDQCEQPAEDAVEIRAVLHTPLPIEMPPRVESVRPPCHTSPSQFQGHGSLIVSLADPVADLTVDRGVYQELPVLETAGLGVFGA